MMARGFKPVGWVAAVAGAALSCYMLSLNVAAERADVAKLERQIVSARQDIRSLQTELGTRGRMQQLEHWNAEVLALSAPTSAQFLDNAVTLARFETQEKTIEERGKVQMAAAEAPAPAPAPRLAPADYAAAADLADKEPKKLVHQASFVSGPKPAVQKAAVQKPAAPKPEAPKPAVQKVVVAKPAAKPAAKPVELAEAKVPQIKKLAETVKPAALKKAADPKSAAAKKVVDAVKPAPAKKLAEAAPAKKKVEKSVSTKKGGMLDDALLKEIGAAAKSEKASAGAGGR